MDRLTESQERCLNIIIRFVEENSHAPTRRELAELLGQKSLNGVNQKLRQLEKKGFIRMYPARKKRNIVVLSKSRRQTTLFKESD